MASEASGDNWDSLADALGTPSAAAVSNSRAGEEREGHTPPASVAPPAKRERTKAPKTRPPSMFFTDEELAEQQATETPQAEPDVAIEMPVAEPVVKAKPIDKPMPPSVVDPVTKVDPVAQAPPVTIAPAAEIESEPAAAVPAAEGFFASGLTLPDWFPFAKKSTPKSTPPATPPPPAESVAAPSVVEAKAVELAATNVEESSSRSENNDSLEPHDDWLDRPRRSAPHKPRVAEVKQGTADGADVDDTESSTEVVDDGSDSADDQAESDDAPKTKRRRSRRRGRGRGRSPTEHAADNSEENAASDSHDESHDGDETEVEKIRKRPARKRPAAKAKDTIKDDREIDDDDDDDIVDDLRAIDGEDDDDEDSDGAEDGSKKISHRNIPSWLDAITGVVDSNIAHRDQRQRSSWPRSDARPKGGRGRGRRKKTS